MKCRPGTRFYSFQPPTPSLATQTPHPKICISGIAMLTVLFQTTVCTYTAYVVQQRSPNKWKVRSTISATAGLLVQRKKRCRPPSIPPYRWRYTIFCCNWNCNCKHFALLLNFVKLLDQELIPYRCSSCLFFILLGRCSSKILNLRRFKSHRNEIWQDCSSSKYASIDQLIGFLIRRHTFEIAAMMSARRSLLLRLLAAHLPAERVWRHWCALQFLNHGTFVLVLVWQTTQLHCDDGENYTSDIYGTNEYWRGNDGCPDSIHTTSHDDRHVRLFDAVYTSIDRSINLIFNVA